MPPRKGGLYKRLAKTTGTTTKEAQGVVKTARATVAKGNRAGAAKRIEKALSGGAKAGVKASPKRARKAKRAARKITRRIQSRQRTKKTSTRDARKKTSLGPPSATDGGPGGTTTDWRSLWSPSDVAALESGIEEGSNPWLGAGVGFADDVLAAGGSLEAPGVSAPKRGKKPKRTAGRTTTKRRVGAPRKRGR